MNMDEFDECITYTRRTGKVIYKLLDDVLMLIYFDDFDVFVVVSFVHE